MSKLSELSNDTWLTVAYQDDSEFKVMTKEDFINDGYLRECKTEPLRVTVADITIVKFDLNYAIENAGEDETYENWYDDVMNAIDKIDGIDGFINKIDDILKNHPTYWETDDIVEIDIELN